MWRKFSLWFHWIILRFRLGKFFRDITSPSRCNLLIAARWGACHRPGTWWWRQGGETQMSMVWMCKWFFLRYSPIDVWLVKCGHLLWQLCLGRYFFSVQKTPGPKRDHFFHSGAGDHWLSNIPIKFYQEGASTPFCNYKSMWVTPVSRKHLCPTPQHSIRKKWLDLAWLVLEG